MLRQNCRCSKGQEGKNAQKTSGEERRENAAVFSAQKTCIPDDDAYNCLNQNYDYGMHLFERHYKGCGKKNGRYPEFKGGEI